MLLVGSSRAASEANEVSLTPSFTEEEYNSSISKHQALRAFPVSVNLATPRVLQHSLGSVMTSSGTFVMTNEVVRAFSDPEVIKRTPKGIPVKRYDFHGKWL